VTWIIIRIFEAYTRKSFLFSLNENSDLEVSHWRTELIQSCEKLNAESKIDQLMNGQSFLIGEDVCFIS